MVMPTLKDAERFHERYRCAQHAGMPKYLQLLSALQAALRDEFWKVGEKLPTEHAIAKVTAYSLGTVQRAIRELVDGGVLVRIAGKGTFVVRPTRELTEPFVSARFLNPETGAPLPIYASVHRVHFGQFDDRVQQALRPSPGKTVCIERIFTVSDEFRIFSRLYVDTQRFPSFGALSEAELNSSNLKLLLIKTYQLASVVHKQTLEFFAIPEDVARHIGCSPGTQSWLLSITGALQSDEAVYFQQLIIPPNERSMQLPDTVLPRAL